MSSWACVRARTRLWLSADGQNIQYKKSEKYTGVLVPYLQKLTEQQIAKGLVRYAVKIPLQSKDVSDGCAPLEQARRRRGGGEVPRAGEYDYLKVSTAVLRCSCPQDYSWYTIAMSKRSIWTNDVPSFWLKHTLLRQFYDCSFPVIIYGEHLPAYCKGCMLHIRILMFWCFDCTQNPQSPDHRFSVIQ